MTYQDWTGIGYLKESPITGEAGWMLSGSIAGGMTAVNPEKWDDYCRDRLEYPLESGKKGKLEDAQYVLKLGVSDLQQGTVGASLPVPLQVRVLDKDRSAIEGAWVTFTVKKGGGQLYGDGRAKTNALGIAEIDYAPGEKVSENMIYWMDAEHPIAQAVGENIVDAKIDSGLGLAAPFTEYGFPDRSQLYLRSKGPTSYESTIYLFGGCFKVQVEDRFGNPVSNVPLELRSEEGTVSTRTAREGTSRPCCSTPRAPACRGTRRTASA